MPVSVNFERSVPPQAFALVISDTDPQSPTFHTANPLCVMLEDHPTKIETILT